MIILSVFSYILGQFSESNLNSVTWFYENGVWDYTIQTTDTDKIILKGLMEFR
jgi:hypothetical protein